MIGEVDCAGAGRSKCDQLNINGFPTLMYGEPASMTEYKGPRDYKSLSNFVSRDLGKTCGPQALHLCDAETRAVIQGFNKKPTPALEQSLADLSKAVKDADAEYDALLKRLQEEYE